MNAKNLRQINNQSKEEIEKEMWRGKKRDLEDMVEGKPDNLAKIISILSLIIILCVGYYVFSTLTANKQSVVDSAKTTEEVKNSLEKSKGDLQDQVDSLKKTVTELQSKLSDKETAVNNAPAEKVTIEGSLSYPSNYIPKTMKVCATNIETKEDTCTSDQLYDKKYTYGVGYRLELPVGSYNVYASDVGWGDYKAYYSEFAKCGLVTSCGTHDPVEVKLEAGKNLDKINPVDWYNK
ncbi:MAG TPA: hypothetical protein P5096_01580 [Patescibacteria group bacterium]|nr:hypothetical protein [Patescibacteria group bacterium]